MRISGAAGRLAALVVVLSLGLLGLGAGAVALVRRDREGLLARMAAERQAQLAQATLSVSEALNDVADNLRLVSELLGQPGSEPEHQRELQAVLLAVAADKAIAVYGPSGEVQLDLVDPAAPPLAREPECVAALGEVGRRALTAPAGRIVTSLALPTQPPGWYRAFATALPGPPGGPARGSVAVLVDTEPFFAPLRVLLRGPETRVLLLGANGHPAPISDPALAAWYGRTGRAFQAPALAEGLAEAQTGQPGARRLSEEEAAALGLERAEVLASYAPIPMRGSAGWVVLALESTAPLRAHERLVLLWVSLAALVGALFLAAFAAYVVVASRRAVALRESQRHAERLAHLAEKSQKILDHVPTGVLALDAQGRVVAANHALRQRLPQVVPGDDLPRAFRTAPAAVVAWLSELVEAALSTGRVQSLVGASLPLFGEDGQYTLHAVPLSAADPEVRVLLVVEDLSDLRELESQLLRAEKLATVGVLAAGIAHEIGTPLGVVRGRAEYLQSKLGQGHPQASGVTVIIEQIDRVSRTIRQLLDFSRLKPAAVQIVELYAAAASLRELLGIEAERRGVKLEVEVPADLPPVAADPDQLQQVLVNLTLNACDASRAGGRVRLSARTGEVGLTLSIEDQGCGIPPADLHRVFDPFFTTKKRGQGTGLGLTIVDQIVRNHGGRVEIHSEPGRGTRVDVHWPSGRIASRPPAPEEHHAR